jgi:uncharacterized protein
LQCPKCHSEMLEQKVLTQSGEVAIDKCERCSGLWFDSGEAEKLKDEWTSLSIDDGDANVGKIFNEITQIDCPRCLKPMVSMSDPKQPHIRYEVCKDHGVFMDAGEFSDYREITLKEAFDHILDLYRKDMPPAQDDKGSE